MEIEAREIALLAVGTVVGLWVLYGGIRFYAKKVKGDYKELLAKVVDFEFYTLHRERCSYLFSRFYRTIYQYVEDGEYKIFRGELRSNRHTIIPVFLTKGKKAYLYRDMQTGELIEKPNTLEILRWAGILLSLLFALFLFLFIIPLVFSL